MSKTLRRAQWALENLKECYVAPDKIVGSKMNDDLKFKVCMSYIDQAIKKDVLTKEHVMDVIKGDKTIVQLMEEREVCLQ